ncbi:hypothetical protein OC834_001324 [Tilletia horrida]|nr:hypothetical protein OC834_001324 [Tilletia horrida]
MLKTALRLRPFEKWSKDVVCAIGDPVPVDARRAARHLVETLIITLTDGTNVGLNTRYIDLAATEAEVEARNGAQPATSKLARRTEKRKHQGDSSSEEDEPSTGAPEARRASKPTRLAEKRKRQEGSSSEENEPSAGGSAAGRAGARNELDYAAYLNVDQTSFALGSRSDASKVKEWYVEQWMLRIEVTSTSPSSSDYKRSLPAQIHAPVAMFDTVVDANRWGWS